MHIDRLIVTLSALMVSDNGVGLPPDVDWQDPPSLGLQLIHMLTRQLRGTLALDRSAGTAFKITFADRKLSRGWNHDSCSDPGR